MRPDRPVVPASELNVELRAQRFTDDRGALAGRWVVVNVRVVAADLARVFEGHRPRIARRHADVIRSVYWRFCRLFFQGESMSSDAIATAPSAASVISTIA